MSAPERFPLEAVRFEGGVFLLDQLEPNATEMIIPVRGTFPVFEPEPEEVETDLVASFAQPPVRMIQELSGASLKFPVNPTEGYIDASIYLANVHNPVDITALRFGPVNELTVQVWVEAELLFEFERSHWANCKVEFQTTLALKSNP